MHIGADFYSLEEIEGFGFKSLGKNVKIKKNASIYFSENVQIGDNVRIDDFSIIVASNNITTIGSNVHIAAHCYIAASEGFEMKDFSGLAPGVNIFTGSDDYSGEKMTNPTIDKVYTGGAKGTVVINRHCIIGSGAVILPNVTIGEGAAVGALTLVNKSLSPWGIYFGIPAKKIKNRSQNLLNLEKEFLNCKMN